MTLDIRANPVPIEVNADGVALIGGTRVTLDTVVGAFKLGATAEEIVQQYSALTLPDVYAVLAYYLWAQDEVETYLTGRQARAAEVRAANERQFDPNGIRARLLARRQGN